MTIEITKKGETASKPRSVFFQVGSPSVDSETAPLDPDPEGRRLPAASAHFAGRVGRESLVSNPDTDGMSLTIFHFAPGTLLPRHRHNVDYIEFVLEGEVHHGNRVVGPGGGVYRSGGVPYSFYAGPEGATIADFRAKTWYTTEYLDDPSEWPSHKEFDADAVD
jgi:hypothetical protein